jgi:hypothetical protein
MEQSLASVIAAIRTGAVPLFAALAALIRLLNDDPIPVSGAGDFAPGATTRTATVIQTFAARKTVLAYALRVVGLTSGAAGTVNVTSGSRTITGGAIGREALDLGATGIYRALRPVFMPEAQSLVVDITDPSAPAGGALVVDGYAVDPDTARVIQSMVGQERIYAMDATPTQQDPTTLVQTGAFEIQDLFRDGNANAGTAVRLYLGDRNNVFPRAMSGAQIAPRAAPLSLIGRTTFPVGTQFRLQTEGIVAPSSLTLYMRGGEFPSS